ncbi:MAG: FAD-dependent monooxygenase, partial [Gammaproteobacteria bacterium]|nr:FAD-dependent monooxygenase [Gammaproteobacteria bacterium]
ALLHKQADDVWRIDFQMGWDIDRDEALQEENVGAKVRAFLGDDIDFEYDWVSIYTFQCRRMAEFVHDRVIFVGDSAHLVSPFGARGANGGLQDADNLAWKLALVLEGKAPPALLDTYNSERVYGADENIRNSTRSTDFMTPKSEVSRAFRDAALELAARYPFARGFVNSGRLSVPCVLDASPLNSADADEFSARQRPGSVCTDAPVEAHGKAGWLLEHMGDRFVALYYAGEQSPPTDRLAALALREVPIQPLVVAAKAGPGVALVDSAGWIKQHYDLAPGSVYLVRPDQHVAGRWRRYDAEAIAAAQERALGYEMAQDLN